MTTRRRAPAPLGALSVTTTLRRLWGRRSSRPEPPAGRRGAPRLTVDDSGWLRCTACALCAAACPARCIEVEAGPPPWESDRADALLSRNRWPARFDLDLSRCLLCGLCAAACPAGAITLQGTPPPGVAHRRDDLRLRRQDLS